MISAQRQPIALLSYSDSHVVARVSLTSPKLCPLVPIVPLAHIFFSGAYWHFLVARLNKNNIGQHLARQNICVSQENNVLLMKKEKQKRWNPGFSSMLSDSLNNNA